MPRGHPQLVLLPGLGADERFLCKQRDAFPDLIVPAWIEPERRESLPHYAERLAASVRLDGPCVVGGVSLGGMVALEMARHLGASGVALVASCRDPGAVNRFLRLSERLARPVPASVLSWSLVLAPLALGKGSNLPREDRKLLLTMVRETPMAFVKWGSRAVLEWPGLPDPGVPVRHIHGGADWVIRPSRARPDVIIPGGPHVLNVSHPSQVNAFLGECLARASS
jgi:pimeloyl-ACP methyl ester carboxylesterase